MSRMSLEPTQPPVHISTGALPPVKWLGHEVDHSLPSSAGDKEVLSYATVLRMCFHFVWTGTALPLLNPIYSGGF
jgi:hypothetical protein